MEHSEAVQQMTAERYLLDELTPEEREAFEQHVFDCPECALDLRAGSVFITEAKAQLPELVSQSSTRATPTRPAAKKSRWSFWWQPAFAVPAFAVMMTVIAFQNVSTIPSLRRAAGEPRIVESTAIHLGTRGSAHTTVPADRTEGLALSIELPQSSAYSSFVFDLYDPKGKQVWTRTVARSNPDTGDDGIVSLVIPGPGLLQGSYTLSISGITPQTSRVEIDRRVLDVLFNP
jgi:hypothetical protein